MHFKYTQNSQRTPLLHDCFRQCKGRQSEVPVTLSPSKRLKITLFYQVENKDRTKCSTMTEPLNDTIIHRLFKPITNSIHLDSIFITSVYSPSIDNKKKTHRTKSRFRPTTWHHEERNHHTNEIATRPKPLLRFDLSTELSPTFR